VSLTITCQSCGNVVEAQRRTKKFCSPNCAQRTRGGYPQKRNCRLCSTEFEVLTTADANRQYCSKSCSKTAQSKTIKGWHEANPDAQREYARKRLQKNPGYWVDKARQERIDTLALLGGACVVCGVTNRYWLHVDYIPTTKDMAYRHPRNIAYIRRHIEKFRLLCANHHYELTLTGKIEGTDITQ